MRLLKPEVPCKSCIGWGWGCDGYVPADGTGDNGVLVVLEAAGEDEAASGIPTVGKAGHYLWSNLERVGIQREGFRVHNVLSCQPPQNKLRGESYEASVIASCSPLLDDTIHRHNLHARGLGRTPVIIALGRIATKRLLRIDDRHPILKEDYLCYPFWSEEYASYILCADHPSYLMRGNHHLLPVLQFVFQRALEIAREGYQFADPEYLLDPPSHVFASWVEEYLRAVAHDPLNTYLSYDIETPWKKGKAEDKLTGEEDGDGTILRCSFSYKPGNAVSVPWSAEYLPGIQELFQMDGNKCGWNNSSFDDEKIQHYTPINGDIVDGMLAWHVLNSAMPKALGFVTPFYAKRSRMWKHLSDSQPAFYNAKDADMALQCWLGIREDLKKNNLWHVFDRHVLKLNRVFQYMSREGVLRDEAARSAAEARLTGLLADVDVQIEKAVPDEARELKLWKKTPKDTTSMRLHTTSQMVKYCGNCGLQKPLKNHSKFCPDFEVVTLSEPVDLWSTHLPFKLSLKSMLRYQSVVKHKPVTNWKEKRITFDASAIERLMKKYPLDPLYPRILEKRSYDKLRSTYIGVTQHDGSILGGMPVGADGRIHTLFGRDAKTLRSTSKRPNLQNLPRPRGADDIYSTVRSLVIPGGGRIFTARDYSGIEAVLVGYFALSARYIRLAKLDVHSFYTAHALYELDRRISANDLPDTSWDDDRLRTRLAEIKKEFKSERNELYKHLVHGNNFMQGAKGTQEKIFSETGTEYPIDKIKRVMGVYFSLFPEIKTWHTNVMAQADRDGYLRNPFGYTLRFHRVYKWEKIGGEWQHEPGDEANEAIAFLPQSTAAGIITEAMLRLYYDRFSEAGQYLRLLVHDELFNECPIEAREAVDAVLREEMERPIVELPLPKSYGMGSYLSIDTEPKHGMKWGEMR